MPPPVTRGYLTALKAAVVDALQQSFNASYIDPSLRQVRVDIEFPVEKQHYPSIWVNYEDQDTLAIAGIDHREFLADDPNDPSSPMHEVTRWVFGGEVTLTVVALTSRERDALYDEFVRVFAFSRIERANVEFRNVIEQNPFVAVKVNWDELRPHGDGAAPGTPWGTENEVVYEKSVGFDVEGEFVSDDASNELVRLSLITVIATNLDEPGDDSQLI